MTGASANRNFPHITDYSIAGDQLFVVLSWVWGKTLDDYLRAIREKEIPRPVVPEVVRLIRGLSHGLSHLHRRTNLIHGDISPANIVLTSGTSQLVLVDFGSAWPIENSGNKDPGDGVTSPYAAPERLAGHAAEDFRSDQFSLAVVAYELLTMTIPFDQLGGQAGLPELIKQTEKNYLPPSKLLHRAGKLPRQSIKRLDEYFNTSLALHPDNRFPTHQAWLSAIDDLHRSLIPGKQLSAWEEAAISVVHKIAKLLGVSRH
ncbi:serine/threonine protein kinase [Novipirellula artificiosorum]